MERRHKPGGGEPAVWSPACAPASGPPGVGVRPPPLPASGSIESSMIQSPVVARPVDGASVRSPSRGLSGRRFTGACDAGQRGRFRPRLVEEDAPGAVLQQDQLKQPGVAFEERRLAEPRYKSHIRMKRSSNPRARTRARFRRKRARHARSVRA